MRAGEQFTMWWAPGQCRSRKRSSADASVSSFHIHDYGELVTIDLHLSPLPGVYSNQEMNLLECLLRSFAVIMFASELKQQKQTLFALSQY